MMYRIRETDTIHPAGWTCKSSHRDRNIFTFFKLIDQFNHFLSEFFFQGICIGALKDVCAYDPDSFSHLITP